MSVARDVAAEAEHRCLQRERLRNLLLTGRTFTTSELVHIVSPRFGARLMELRRGVDGPALDVRTARLNGKGSDFAYQCVGTLTAPEQLGAESLRKRLAVVRARQTRLREEEAAILERLVGVSP